MKIKKLFHWLYAILMLLPVFYIGGRVFYTIFNKNAKDSYSGSTYQVLEPVYYDTNEITSNNDIISGNLYKWVDGLTLPTSNWKLICNVSYCSLGNYTRMYLENDYLVLAGNQYLVINEIDYNFYFVPTNLQSANFPSDFYTAIEQSDIQIVKEYIEVDQDYTLDTAFEYSMNQLNEIPLFSWATSTFLNQPFTYISGLFGIAANNPINTLLSYWLSISIIWLVFDLIMYVPLLVHRWIDKGGID